MFAFYSVSVSFSVEFCRLCFRKNKTQRRRKQKENGLIPAFALRSLLCLREAHLHGNITSTDIRELFRLCIPSLRQ